MDPVNCTSAALLVLLLWFEALCPGLTAWVLCQNVSVKQMLCPEAHVATVTSLLNLQLDAVSSPVAADDESQ